VALLTPRRNLSGKTFYQRASDNHSLDGGNYYCRRERLYFS